LFVLTPGPVAPEATRAAYGRELQICSGRACGEAGQGGIKRPCVCVLCACVGESGECVEECVEECVVVVVVVVRNRISPMSWNVTTLWLRDIRYV